MSTIVYVNNVPYSVPTTGETGWGQNVSSLLQALAGGGLLQLVGGDFTLLDDVDFGPNFGLVSPYFKSDKPDIATDGVLRLATDESIEWRNSTDSGNLVLELTGDLLTFDGKIISSPLTTKGDLYTYSTTPTRLPVGTNGYVLTADSSEATGLKWIPTIDGTVTSVAATGSADITVGGSPITTSGTLTFALSNTTVTPATYGSDVLIPVITVDAKGRVTSVVNTSITPAYTGTVTSVAATGSADITVGGSPITTSGTLTFALSNTTVTPGSYTATNITVDAKGRITAASNGAGTDTHILNILSTSAASQQAISSGETLFSSTLTMTGATGYYVSLANGNFIGGSNGSASLTTINTSPDGITWTPRTLPTQIVPYELAAYGSGLYVVLTAQSVAGGVMNLATSSNLTSWTARTATGYSGSPITGFTTNGTSFFATTSIIGEHLYSANGTTWAIQTTPGDSLTGTIFHTAANLYMAFPGNSSTYYTSPDALTWTSRTGPTTFTTSVISTYPVYIGGEVYIGTAGSLGPVCYKTSDAINWTFVGYLPGTVAPQTSNFRPIGLTKVNNMWICNAPYTGVFTSPDFLNWTPRNRWNDIFAPGSIQTIGTTSVLTGPALSGLMVSSTSVNGLFM